MQIDLRDVALIGAAAFALLLAVTFVILIWSAALGHPVFSLPGWHSLTDTAAH
jgi:hypothetical protein